MTDCIFCKIVSGDLPSANVYKDEQVTAFRDIHPAAPTHILIVPNKHIDSANTMTPGDKPLVGHMIFVARELAEKEGIAESGYRLIMNTNAHGGQTVFHMHLHLLGGAPMKHPMG